MELISGVYSFPATMIDFNGFNDFNGTVWGGIAVEIF